MQNKVWGFFPLKIIGEILFENGDIYHSFTVAVLLRKGIKKLRLSTTLTAIKPIHYCYGSSYYYASPSVKIEGIILPMFTAL